MDRLKLRFKPQSVNDVAGLKCHRCSRPDKSAAATNGPVYTRVAPYLRHVRNCQVPERSSRCDMPCVKFCGIIRSRSAELIGN
jgi:hypothetical protein